MANILVVEDTNLSLQLLDFFLKRDNHTVLKANNGLEAIDCLQTNPVDLVITDLNMPEMDGFSLLERMRSNDQYRDLPVIVLTASGVERTEQLAFEKGATAFLTQPYSSKELGKLVSDCLGEN